MHAVVLNNANFLESVFPGDSSFLQTDGKHRLNSSKLVGISYSVGCLHHHMFLKCFQVDHLFEDNVDPLFE